MAESQKRRARSASHPVPRTLYLIKRVQFAAYVQLEETLLPFGLTAAQYSVLSIVRSLGDQSSAQLARRFAVTPQTMIKLIATLEERGLIQRSASEGNRKTLQVTLSEAGARALTPCERAVDGLEKRLFGAFTAEELQVFRGFMQRVVANAGEPKG